VGSAILIFAAILTTVSPLAAILVAALAVLWEVFVFYRLGLT
jgi:hypothetical protein